MFGFDTVIVQEWTSAGVCGGICKIRVLLPSLQIEQNFTRFSYPTGQVHLASLKNWSTW